MMEDPKTAATTTTTTGTTSSTIGSTKDTKIPTTLLLHTQRRSSTSTISSRRYCNSGGVNTMGTTISTTTTSTSTGGGSNSRWFCFCIGGNNFVIYFLLTTLLFPIISFTMLSHVYSSIQATTTTSTSASASAASSTNITTATATNLIDEFFVQDPRREYLNKKTTKQQQHRLSKKGDNDDNKNKNTSNTTAMTMKEQKHNNHENININNYNSNNNNIDNKGYDEPITKTSSSSTFTTSNQYTVAGLSCSEYGGPKDDIAQEMVYWQNIPSDALFVSPLKATINNNNNNRNNNDNGAVMIQQQQQQYITFEPDHGGWNNIRMSMETVMGMAFAMGRTLVLPPETGMYLLGQGKHSVHGQGQRDKFAFTHFFPMDAIHTEHPGLDVISMDEFLINEALSGHMIDTSTNQISYPPNNRTNWDGDTDLRPLWEWLRSVTLVPLHWNPEECLAVFPESKNKESIHELLTIREEILNNIPEFESYVDKPVPINATPLERMKENWAGRKDICLYNETMQDAPYIHFPCDSQIDARLLTHFYAFLFFQNYKHDLWMKRFVRDHIRYNDEIQCAAARIVAKVRERASRRDPVINPLGLYDAFHVRRGDFQYKKTRVEAKELLRMAKLKLEDGASLYIATDEHSKAFFRPLMDHYHVMFMDDFEDELHGVNSNYFGMIDALVASRSRIFYGCWFSTFTGYINRLRGYHADREKQPGYEFGLINSYFYALSDRFDHMRHYYPVKQVFYAREFPTAWRLIDSTVSDPL